MDVKARNGVLEFTLNVKLIFHLERKQQNVRYIIKEIKCFKSFYIKLHQLKKKQHRLG